MMKHTQNSSRWIQAKAWRGGLRGAALLALPLALVALLMIIFPVSKLLHAPGVFFSPTRNQRDNPREKRHIQGWTADDSATSKPV